MKNPTDYVKEFEKTEVGQSVKYQLTQSGYNDFTATFISSLEEYGKQCEEKGRNDERVRWEKNCQCNMCTPPESARQSDNK